MHVPHLDGRMVDRCPDEMLDLQMLTMVLCKEYCYETHKPILR